MKKVLIPTKLNQVAADLLEKEGYSVIQDSSADMDDLISRHSDTEILIVRSNKITSEVIDALPELKLIVRAGAGYNTIDIKYARRKKIDVMNTPGANSNAVAEEVIAMILTAYRNIVEGHVSTVKGEWKKKQLMGCELTGKTVGILGMGNIGQLLVKRLQGFNVEILAFDPVLSADLAEKLDVQLCTAEEIFANADIISLHIPETPQTKEMINERFFDLMKDGAMLVNCARAGVLDEDALRKARKDKNIIFCNDVYSKDTSGEKSVADIADLLLPHLGASTKEANFNAAQRAAQQIIAFYSKGITNYVVNKGVPDGLDENFQNLAFVLAKIARAYLGPQNAPHEIETSFYGELKKYSKWMLSPIAAGLSNEFDPMQDASEAEDFFKEKGIELLNREVDDNKKYGESMTIDLYEGSNVINKVSIRGTIAEANLMISRVNGFDKLYLEPTGNNLFVEYSDEPGVLAKITNVLGKNNINILDLRAPQDIKQNRSLAVIKTNKPVDSEIVDEIVKNIKDGRGCFVTI